jgi:type VI secretion system secreted protein Hcp
MAIGDMFLKVETARSGVIKGESSDEKHPNEIDIVGWSWGMRGDTGLAGAGAGSKATLNQLEVVKRVDSASTGLMSAMRNNELIKKAVLSVRKAGGGPLEYFRITIEKGRVTSLDMDTEGTEVVEKLSLAYQRISVEYTPQGSTGGARGSMTFEAEIT